MSQYGRSQQKSEHLVRQNAKFPFPDGIENGKILEYHYVMQNDSFVDNVIFFEGLRNCFELNKKYCYVVI